MIGGRRGGRAASVGRSWVVAAEWSLASRPDTLGSAGCDGVDRGPSLKNWTVGAIGVIVARLRRGPPPALQSIQVIRGCPMEARPFRAARGGSPPGLCRQAAARRRGPVAIRLVSGAAAASVGAEPDSNGRTSGAAPYGAMSDVGAVTLHDSGPRSSVGPSSFHLRACCREAVGGLPANLMSAPVTALAPRLMTPCPTGASWADMKGSWMLLGAAVPSPWRAERCGMPASCRTPSIGDETRLRRLTAVNSPPRDRAQKVEGPVVGLRRQGTEIGVGVMDPVGRAEHQSRKRGRPDRAPLSRGHPPALDPHAHGGRCPVAGVHEPRPSGGALVPVVSQLRTQRPQVGQAGVRRTTPIS